MTVHEQALKYMSECDVKITEDNVLNFIALMKGIDPYTRELMEEIFMRGDCGRFYFILKSVFPEAVPYAITQSAEALEDSNITHVVTKIGDKFYDIKGIFDEERLHGIEGYEEKSWSESVLPTTEQWLYFSDLFNNYSFEFRGPIL